MSANTWSEQAQFIDGPVGCIEIRLGQHTESKQKSGLIMCHPHPLFSGTMDNKVVTTLVRGAARLSIESSAKSKVHNLPTTLDTVRFNFRGVGQSEGEHDHGKGEQEDLGAIVDYVVNQLGWQKVYLAGFSFGSGVACLYAAKHAEKYAEKLAGLFLVAPAVHNFDAPATLPFEFESHVYMGDADEVVPFNEVEHWVDLVTPQPHWRVFEGAGHFFHGRLVELKNTFLQDLTDIIV